MAFATGGYHGLRFIKETSFGVTPGTPEMTSLRHTSCGLVLAKDSFTSNELRDDRQISDMRQGANQVNGPIGFEFSYGEYDPWLEVALFGTWDTDVLKAGVTPGYFTVERAFSDIAQYGVFTGCMINTFSLSIQPNAIVTGSFGMIGKGAGYSGSPLDASPTASQTNSAFDSFTGTLKEGGTEIAVVTGLELSLDNTSSAQYVLGSADTPAITNGNSNLTGTLSAFFENAAMLNKFINETESSIEMTFGDGISKSYVLEIPRVKYSGADNTVDSTDPVVLEMPFQATLDPAEGTNLKITRIP